MTPPLFSHVSYLVSSYIVQVKTEMHLAKSHKSIAQLQNKVSHQPINQVV